MIPARPSLPTVARAQLYTSSSQAQLAVSLSYNLTISHVTLKPKPFPYLRSLRILPIPQFPNLRPQTSSLIPLSHLHPLPNTAVLFAANFVKVKPSQGTVQLWTPEMPASVGHAV